MAEVTAPAFMRVPDVLALTGLPRSTLYALAQNGDFPSQVRLTAKSVAFRRDEVLTWIEARPAVYATQTPAPQA